jgi:YesN/AraC family two-component response regulator
MALIKVLLVDDDEMIRLTLAEVLKIEGFDVTAAANVPEALWLIASEQYDVLLTDLHMPGHGDGLTVVSAMRHSNPKAVTMILSAFPEMGAASRAILLQTDEILVKPQNVALLVGAIKQRLVSGPLKVRKVESVAGILERISPDVIADWYQQIETESLLMDVPMSREARCGHLRQVFRDLDHRLLSTNQLGTKEIISDAAAEHGLNRRKQGYSAAMMVEESRQLQVCIFRGLQDNNASLDFSVVLLGVMTIADEIDSQLSQAMTAYVGESVRDSNAAATATA